MIADHRAMVWTAFLAKQKANITVKNKKLTVTLCAALIKTKSHH
jgi:hypothetical protein